MVEETTTNDNAGGRPGVRAGVPDTSFIQERVQEGPVTAVDEDIEAEGFSLKRALRMLFIGLIGFILGIIFFLPAEALWLKALNKLNTDSTSIDWEMMEPAGLFGARLHNARLGVNGLELHFSMINIDPGLTSPISIRASTGEPVINASLSWSGRLKVQGNADTGFLIGANKSLGTSEVLADLLFDDWTDIPEQGSLTIQGLDLDLPNKLALANLNLSLTKQGQEVRIDTLSADKPFPLQASGLLKLDDKNLLASSYSVSGKIRMGGKNNKFKKSGTIGELSKLAANGGVSRFLK